MNKRIQLLFLTIVLLMASINTTAFAAQTDFYVSPTGNDSNSCTITAPCKTIQKGVNMVQPGDVLHILSGTYSESISISKTGTQNQPIRIVGENAVLSNGGQLAFSIKNSQWLSFEGFSINGYTLSIFEITQSHFLTFRNNVFDYTFAAIRIKDGVSHVLVENNEMYQSYPAGSTWSSLKGSKYEGGGIYASSGGQGMYIIRGNYFHDSMNGVYIWDSGAGPWMNANIFISDNTFKNIVDDPFEPEGDSFNIHFFNNTLINTHRMVSIVPDAACTGPIFVYGNYQQNTMDPTGEANTGRLNSVIKMDMSAGTCPNGVWVFNNTVNANITGTNFYGVDLISSSVKNYNMLNNVFITEKNVYSGTPQFTNSLSDFNISLKPFGYIEPHGLQADPLLNTDGTLQTTSPANGRSTPIDISNYFAISQIVPVGADLGAFRSFPAPKYVLPPGGEPADFPTNVGNWPDIVTPAPPVPSPTPTQTAPAGQGQSPFVSTTLIPSSVLIGETSTVAVNFNNVPDGGFASAEFTCTYNPVMVEISAITPADLFGADPITVVNGPQNGSFVFAVAGSIGNKATSDGTVFTFSAKGLQVGQPVIGCQARASVGDLVLITIPSTPASLDIIDNIPTIPTPTQGIFAGQVHAGKPVTITLKDQNGSVAGAVVANPDGTFNISLPEGTYTAVASASGYLRAQGTVNIASGSTTTLQAISLLAGDIDGNGVIDHFDALTIGINYNGTEPTAADLSNDGTINVLELEILSPNYRQIGPLTISTTTAPN